MANGDIRKLGTFYMNNVKQARPTMPWGNGSTPNFAPGAGNTPKYTSGNIQIRDTDASDAYKINWIEVNDGDKKLLIADRNILVSVSWDTLNAQGLIFGKEVTIDGQQYKLRVLTGGSSRRGGTDQYSGALPIDNEWDRIITNESSFSGLPVPNTTDLDGTPNETDRYGEHNSKWNWYFCFTWCQETRAEDTSNRSIRGYNSAPHCDFFTSSHVNPSFGWRPVLEEWNSAPLISGSDGSLGVLTEPLIKQYTVSDGENDSMTITEKIDGKVIRTLTNQNNGNYTLDLTETWNSLSEGLHKVEIVAQDSGGLKSTRTWQFGKGSESNKIKLGTLYMNNVKQLNPTMPWANGSTPEGAPGAGNIPKYTSGNLEIRDTDVSDAYKINWVEVNDGGKKLLISDRNILVNVSWDTLNAQGLIFGKEVTVDGQQYKLRVLTGGSSYRPGGSYFEGGWPSTNEWDRIITNESNFSGLPVPNATDLDNTPNETDRLGVHNSKWNWYQCRTWCQETHIEYTSRCSYRGFYSARNCYFSESSTVVPNVGWRPVLEVLNSAPIISDYDGSLGVLTEPLIKQYTVSDGENDSMTITEKVDDNIIRTLTNQNNGNYVLNLTEIWDGLSDGLHKIEIIAQDSKGMESTRTWQFGKSSESNKIKLGTLYMDGVKQLNPTMPWNGTPAGAPGAGNIPKYNSGNIEIRDTHVDEEYKIKWTEVNDGDKKLLIADRNILCKVSWDTLNAQGLIFGKEIIIDGKKYNLRVLTGGSSYRIEKDQYSGGSPSTNEWDRIITNESNFSGLPVPNTTDLDKEENETDRLGSHNLMWNWYKFFTWCQETGDKDASKRPLRGYVSSRYSFIFTSSFVDMHIGWRPVLEPITPEISYLYKDNDGYKYYTDTWNLIGEEVTESDFELYGSESIISDIEILNQLVGTPKIVISGTKNGSTKLPVRMMATPKEQITIQKNDINVSGVKKINFFRMNGNGRVLFSLDGGITYKTVVNSNFEDVNLNENIYDIAIDKDLLESLPVEILDEMVNSNFIRIAYILRDNDAIDNISVQVSTKETLTQVSAEIDFDIIHTSINKASIRIYKDGSYMVNSFVINDSENSNG